MPVAVAIALRYIIMAALQLALWTLLEKYGIPLLNKAVQSIMEKFGVDEETAKDIMANKVLLAFEDVGIFAITLKTKMPIKVAEYLGFTSKGFALRKLAPAVEAKIAGTAAKVVTTAAVTAEDVAVAAEVAATRTKVPVATAKVVLDYIMKFTGLGFLGVMTVSNVIDFGNWNNGAYQKLLQRVIAVVSFGLVVPDPKVPKSSVLSADVWNRTYAVYTELGAAGINDPFKMQSVFFTRQNLIDLVDKIAAAAVADGKDIGLKQILAATTALVVFKDTAAAVKIAENGGATSTVVVAPSGANGGSTENQPVAQRTTPQVHVFSGVVSQGVIGSTATFTPRPDDLIENADELAQASHNNLAPFIAAIPSRMSYEIKVVSSIKAGNGFTQRGTAQRIVSGYNKDGSPKYRTVVNKFAVMDIFIKTDRGVQTKITTIVLGPVDAVKFQNANVNLGAVAVDVKQNIVAGASVLTPAAQPITAPVVPISAKGVFQDHNPPFFSTLYKIVNGARLSYNPYPDLYTQAERDQLSQDPNKFAGNEQKLKERGVITSEIGTVPFIADKQPGETAPERAAASFEEFFGAKPSTTTPTSEAQKSTTGATTLFEYYKARGENLPNIEERAKLYEQLALGQAAYYTGTAEQNTKLLAALQGTRL